MAKKTVYTLTMKSAFDVEESEDRFFYVKTDVHQYPRQLVSVKLNLGSGSTMYGLASDVEDEVFFYEREISEVENVILRQKFGDE